MSKQNWSKFVEKLSTDILVTIIELLRFLNHKYLTTTGITMQSLKSIRQFEHAQVNGKKLYGRMNGPTLFLEKFCF